MIYLTSYSTIQCSYTPRTQCSLKIYVTRCIWFMFSNCWALLHMTLRIIVHLWDNFVTLSLLTLTFSLSFFAGTQFGNTLIFVVRRLIASNLTLLKRVTLTGDLTHCWRNVAIVVHVTHSQTPVRKVTRLLLEQWTWEMEESEADQGPLRLQRGSTHMHAHTHAGRQHLNRN